MPTNTAPTTGNSYSTDASGYTAQTNLDGIPTDVLQAVYLDAEHTYKVCGGHRLAEQMRGVMRHAEARLIERGVWS